MSATRFDSAQARADASASLRAHWLFFLIEGLVLLCLGIAAVTVPPLATLAVESLIGWLVLLSGILGLVMTLRARAAPGFGWSLVSALLGVVAGVILLARPLTGALSLTVILTVFLALEGIVSILYALDHRRESTSRWAFMAASGAVDLVLAGMIFAGLPATAAWAIGLLVGINLIFGGTALIAMALGARNGGVTT